MIIKNVRKPCDLSSRFFSRPQTGSRSIVWEALVWSIAVCKDEKMTCFLFLWKNPSACWHWRHTNKLWLCVNIDWEWSNPGRPWRRRSVCMCVVWRHKDWAAGKVEKSGQQSGQSSASVYSRQSFEQVRFLTFCKLSWQGRQHSINVKQACPTHGPRVVLSGPRFNKFVSRLFKFFLFFCRLKYICHQNTSKL